MSDLLSAELKKAGRKVDTSLCEHFPFSRQELFQIVKVKGYRTFGEVVAGHGRGHGCEICKPAIASILASLWNEVPVERHLATLQDTNDASWPTFSEAVCTRSCREFLAARSRRRNSSSSAKSARGTGCIQRLPVVSGSTCSVRGAPAADDLGRTGRCGIRERPRLRQVAAHREELRRHDMVPLRSGGFGRFRDPCREPIQRPPLAHKLKSAVSGCVRECAEAKAKTSG